MIDTVISEKQVRIRLEKIAKCCHEVNRSYCASLGDFSQPRWEDANQEIKESAVNGVIFALDHPHAPLSAQHDSWMQDKINAGWSYGTVKNSELKQHPCIRNWNQLPHDQQVKDYLFRATALSVHEVLDPI